MTPPVAIGLLLAVNLALAGLVLVLRVRNERTARRRRAIREEWHPLLVELVGGDRSAVELQGRVSSRDTSEVVELIAEFARRLSGSDREKLLELAAPLIGAIGGQLHSARPQTRARAVRLLGELAFPAYRPEIVGALDDPSPLVSMLAATALSSARAVDDAGRLIARVDRFSAWSPGYLASLVSAMGPAVSEDARRLLSDREAGDRTREVAARALAILHDGGSADTAASVLEAEDDEEILNSCLRLLQVVGSARHAAVVRPLVSHPAFSVRANACTVLGRIGNGTDIEKLRMLIFDESPWVAIHAAEAVARLGGTEVLEDLANRSHERATVAAEAIEGAVA